MKLRKAYSVGFSWVFGLVTLFGLGVLYIVFNEVFEAHLVPVIKGMVDPSTYFGSRLPPETANLIINNIDKFMAFFHSLPYILFFLVIIYMVLVAIRKEKEDSMY